MLRLGEVPLGQGLARSDQTPQWRISALQFAKGSSSLKQAIAFCLWSKGTRPLRINVYRPRITQRGTFEATQFGGTVWQISPFRSATIPMAGRRVIIAP